MNSRGVSLEMAQSGVRVLESGSENTHSQPTPDEILCELRRIVESPLFSGSKRCQQFLQYVCEKSLQGQAGSLKERAVAIEVFGRSPQSDLAEDTIVRVGAREVRKRLAQFYMTAEGSASVIRVNLPSGTYAPEFRYVEEKEDKHSEEISIPAPVPVPSHALPAVSEPASRPPYVWIALALIVGAGLALFVTNRTQSPSLSGSLGQFWQPVLASPDPLLLVVGHPVVYHPSTRALQLSEQRLPKMAVPLQRPLQLDPKQLDGSDIVPVFNQYVGFGDMVVGTEVAAMLARQSKNVRVRLASSVPFADLRQAHAVMIGAFTNRWTMELGRNWRFRFDWNSAERTFIVDSDSLKTGKPQDWRVRASDDGLVSEDYILVSRIINSSAGGVQIVAAGIKQFGTEAAGRLLTDGAQLDRIVSQLPENWKDKNLQLVLHVTVIGNTPDQPELVAWHVW